MTTLAECQALLAEAEAAQRTTTKALVDTQAEADRLRDALVQVRSLVDGALGGAS